MPTNSAASAGRNFDKQMIHYLRAGVTFADNGNAVVVGTIPAGAAIIKPISGAVVSTAFNAGTTNTLNIGTSANDDLYATLISIGATNFVALDENVSNVVAVDTEITATVVLTGTAATAGEAEVVIAYVLDNDR